MKPSLQFHHKISLIHRQFIVWALWLGVGLLAACGPSASPPPSPAALPMPSELIFYDWEDDMPQSVLDAFTAEYGIKVTYLTYEAQEEAIENIKMGQQYDVVVMESRFVPLLVQSGLLAELDHRNLPNLRNLSANFRDLIYDPGNHYCIPFNWGTTGLVVRSDLVAEPITRWADLWDPRYAGRVGLWVGQRREVIALTLKSLGYSANSEKPAELEEALARLLELKPHIVALEDFDLANSVGVMTSGRVIVAMGYANDVLLGREENPAITYVLPEEGALLWGDTFIIPANSPHIRAAETFLNFILRPEISAQIANENFFATPNEAARPFIAPELINDPVIYPPASALVNAEIILPLSPLGQRLYDEIWRRLAGEE